MVEFQYPEFRLLQSRTARVALIGFVLGFAGAGFSLAQNSVDPKDPESAEKQTAQAGEKSDKDSAAGEATPKVVEPVAKEKSAEEFQKQMLEKLADNLSTRATALSGRERAIAEREKALSSREKALQEREALLEARENVVRRREKLPPPQAWNGPKAPNIVGKYAAVIDGNTMQFYHEKSGASKTPVASTQKLLTALIVCSESDLDEEIEVPEEVLRVEPTVIGVKPGQKYTRRELLRALLVRSGNDIAATLAIDNAGSIEAFAVKMNDFARSLGMETSNFINPHGLPAEGQYSSAHDMALAAFEAYQNPDIREMVKTRTCTFTFSDGSKRELYNTNKVLTSYSHCNGMKTGFTYASGHCLVCSGSKEGQDRIVVVINSHKPYVWSDSEKLLDWALNLEIEPASEGPTVTVAVP